MSAFLEQFLAHFHFLRPWWWLAALPLYWSLWQLHRAGQPQRKWQQLIAPHLLNAILLQHHDRRRISPLTLAALLLLLTLTALAGPSWQRQASPLADQAATIVIMLDASESMAQQDLQPTRLARAKQKIRDLLQLQRGSRIGLIVYAGSAHSVIPPTSDPQVITSYLEAISTTIMPVAGKAPELGLPLAQQMLGEHVGNILMLGDGIGPNSIAAFSRFFAEQPHHLLLLGVGTTQAVGLPLEETQLRKLAAVSHGVYQPLTIDRKDVKALQRRIITQAENNNDRTRPWIDAGYLLLYPIALLLLLWFRRGWSLNWQLALLCACLLSQPLPVMAAEQTESEPATSWQQQWMQLWLTPDQLGRYYLKRGEYLRAARSFDNIYWRAVAYYRAEHFQAAAELFARIPTVAGYFNLGNAYAHARRYLRAVQAYDQALKLQPDHAGALKNRRRVQQIIDETQQLSDSQLAEDEEASQELGDAPKTSEGSERKQFAKRQRQQLTAEEALNNAAINALWMRQVQKDPARFLRAKFHMQLQGTQP